MGQDKAGRRPTKRPVGRSRRESGPGSASAAEGAGLAPWLSLVG